MQEHPPQDSTPAPLSNASTPGSPDALASGPKPASAAPDVAAPAAPASEAQSAEAVRDSGANWFYWIAALSLLNTVLVLFNSTRTMSLGLGATLVVDAIAKDVVAGASSTGATIMRVVELVLDALIIGFFVLCGTKAKRGKSWAFVVGGVLLLLDTLLVGFAQMWISVALHAWALFSIFAGWNANKKALQLRAQESAVAGSPWAR